jgi:hypothetical protein
VHLSIAGANCNEGGTQNNLGNALRTLGERESDTARLEAAVSAFRDVLKEFTRKRAPAYQGIVQRSLEMAEKLLAARTCPVGRNGSLVLVRSWRHKRTGDSTVRGSKDGDQARGPRPLTDPPRFLDG